MFMNNTVVVIVCSYLLLRWPELLQTLIITRLLYLGNIHLFTSAWLTHTSYRWRAEFSWENAKHVSVYHQLFSALTWPHFYQTGSAWSMDQGSTKNHSPVNNFAPTVTKLCVMWEGQALPHDTKFRNCRDKIVEGRRVPNWSLTHGSSWSGLIKVGAGADSYAVA